ncbi:MAG: efflux RND transporter permease subunit [Candidatus Promineifilaceae bacterium]
MLSSFFDKITRLSIRLRWIVITVAVVVLIGGIYAMLTLNLEMLPNIEFPQTIVVAQWSDAESAEQFLEEVTIPLEEVVGEVDGVVNLESTTSHSFAFIIARSEFGLNKDSIIEDIETAVANIELPEGVETPQVINIGLGDLPVVVASASSDALSLPELKALVEADLVPLLEDITDIEQVTISGGQELPEPAESVNETAQEPVQGSSEDVGDSTEPVALPPFLRQGAQSFGVDIEYAHEITPQVLAKFVGAVTVEDMLQGLAMFQELLPDLPAETIALLPIEFVDSLDQDTRDQLDQLASEEGGTGQYTAAEVLTLLSKELTRLPEEMVAGAAAFGIELAYAEDITPEFMQQMSSFGPQALQALQLLTDDHLRALQPQVIAMLPMDFVETLDPSLKSELDQIAAEFGGAGGLLAAASDDEAAAPTAPALAGPWLEDSADGTPSPFQTAEDLVENNFGFSAAQLLNMLSASPQVEDPAALIGALTPDVVVFLVDTEDTFLDEIAPEVLVLMSPETLASLLSNYPNAFDADMMKRLSELAASAESPVGTETPEAGSQDDPARLPDLLIQGANQFGIDIEYSYDITPEFMQMLGSIGPQSLQVLQLLTPDNLRNMQPEVIAMLPADFLATLDEGLVQELDELSSEYGGAGALANASTSAAEQEEPTEQDANAPVLTGPWIEPAEDGSPSIFQTAGDLLNNPFVPGAAALLNVLPNSPEIDDAAPFMAALTPEVLGYLADNEANFAADLEPSILEMMSPEALSFLLETYPDAFDSDLTERLAGIAAGTVTVFVPESSITRTKGNPGVVLNLFKRADSNTVEVAHRLFDALAQYEDENPEIQVSYVFEQATFIEDSITSVAREGLLGAFFAIIVILIFLSGRVRGKFRFSWRSTIVVGVSIPLSVFAAMLVMRVMPPTLGTWINDLANETGNGPLTFIARLLPATVTLNLMTLSGMTVAIGRVVDDSIVVLENSYRFIQKGGDRKEAVLKGTKEVAIAIFASTATTIAVFLPLGMMGGIIGAFFLPFGLTVTYALAASFIVAITVVPALTYVLIRKENIPDEKETSMQRAYTPILEWSLNHRGITMVIATVIFIASLFLLTTLPQSFIPAIGEPTINVTVQLENGTSMADTDTLTKEFEAVVKEMEGIESWQAEVGSAGGFESFFAGGGVSQNLANIVISVEDQDELAALTEEIRTEANDIFGEENTVVSAASQTGFSGFSLIIASDSLEELKPVVGDIEQALGAVDIDEDGKPDLVNVSSNVDQEMVGGDGTIIRIDGRPAVSFSAELETSNTLGVTRAAKEAVAGVPNLPTSAEVSEGFESEQQVQGFQQMIEAIGISIVIVYVIMALTFKSLIHPLTILFSLPFALVGAALALFLSGAILSISAMIGLMMLVGIVVTNAIVLLELVQQLREHGAVAYDALVQGGRTRLRPIWMTALAAILALLPLALSQEGGAIIAAELATVVIGGLLVSTSLTLLVVPVVYSLFDQLGSKFRREPA